MTAGCIFSVLIAQIFVQTPAVLLLVLALLIFFAFLLLARGQVVPVASILLITTSVVPLVAVSSLDLAYGLVYTLIAGSILAALLVFSPTRFFRHAMTHERGHQAACRGGFANRCRARQCGGTPQSHHPVHVQRIAGERHRDHDGHHHSSPAGRSWRWHRARLDPGQPCRGLAATAAYVLVTLLPSPAFLLLVALLVGLLFGDRIARVGSWHRSTGRPDDLSHRAWPWDLSLAEDSGTFFISRVFDVMVAAVYAIGMASLLRGAFGAR